MLLTCAEVRLLRNLLLTPTTKAIASLVMGIATKPCSCSWAVKGREVAAISMLPANKALMPLLEP